MIDLRIFRRHLASTWPPTAGTRYCARGARAFFERRGWSWPDFLRNGRQAEDFIATGDAMALKAVSNAREEAARGR